jgi:hypothetical protein
MISSSSSVTLGAEPLDDRQVDQLIREPFHGICQRPCGRIHSHRPILVGGRYALGGWAWASGRLVAGHRLAM